MPMTAYERTKLWRQNNKEKLAEQNRNYFLRHRAERNKYQREYAKRRRQELKANEGE